MAVHRNSPQKRAQCVEKPPSTLQIARKLSSGYERIAVHRNSPQQRAQWVEKPPSTLKIVKKISWV